MLRSILAGLGALALLLAFASFSAHEPGFGSISLVWGIVLLGGILIERFRYKTVFRKPPGPGWEQTTERFIDEETGKTIIVYIRPESGERIYVAER